MRIEKIIITFLLVLLISFASYAKSLKKIDKLDFSFQDDLNYENLNEAIEKQITHLASGNFEDSFKLDGRKVAKKEILSTLLEFKKIFNLQQERQVKEYIDDNFRIFTPKGKFHFTAYFVRRYVELIEDKDTPRFTDEVTKVTRWFNMINSRSLGNSINYPRRGRCKTADLFFRYAPRCIRDLE